MEAPVIKLTFDALSSSTLDQDLMVSGGDTTPEDDRRGGAEAPVELNGVSLNANKTLRHIMFAADEDYIDSENLSDSKLQQLEADYRQQENPFTLHVPYQHSKCPEFTTRIKAFDNLIYLVKLDMTKELKMDMDSTILKMVDVDSPTRARLQEILDAQRLELSTLSSPSYLPEVVTQRVSMSHSDFVSRTLIAHGFEGETDEMDETTPPYNFRITCLDATATPNKLVYKKHIVLPNGKNGIIFHFTHPVTEFNVQMEEILDDTENALQISQDLMIINSFDWISQLPVFNDYFRCFRGRGSRGSRALYGRGSRAPTAVGSNQGVEELATDGDLWTSIHHPQSTLLDLCNYISFLNNENALKIVVQLIADAINGCKNLDEIRVICNQEDDIPQVEKDAWMEENQKYL
jgi:hypothetical protein